MSVVNKEFLIEKYGMIPHPEGGYYVETFRSDQSVLFADSSEALITRLASTAIYFLVLPGNVSRLHRILSDEGAYYFHYFNIPILQHSDTSIAISLSELSLLLYLRAIMRIAVMYLRALVDCVRFIFFSLLSPVCLFHSLQFNYT